jgi:hypothetical protein
METKNNRLDPLIKSELALIDSLVESVKLATSVNENFEKFLSSYPTREDLKEYAITIGTTESVVHDNVEKIKKEIDRANKNKQVFNRFLISAGVSPQELQVYNTPAS